MFFYVPNSTGDFMSISPAVNKGISVIFGKEKAQFMAWLQRN